MPKDADGTYMGALIVVKHRLTVYYNQDRLHFYHELDDRDSHSMWTTST